MKKSLLIIALMLLTAASIHADDEGIRIDGDTLRINTTALAPDVHGYNGATPVVITIVQGSVASVEALPNRETKAYFRLTAPLLESWNGLTVRKALSKDVQAVSGATMTSQALIANVERGLKVAESMLPEEEEKKPFPWWAPAGVLLLLGIGSFVFLRIRTIKNR